MKTGAIQLAALFVVFVTSAGASEMHELTPLDNWQDLANGVWKTSIGDMSGELRYTDLAAAPARLDDINQLSDQAFPFSRESIGFSIAEDGKIVVRIPTQDDEEIYGGGLQLDGIKRSKKVVDLRVNPWQHVGRKGGTGNTHAPVPFFISSAGYGVFFNTARYLKLHVQLGNRKGSPDNPESVDRNPLQKPTDRSKRWLANPPANAIEAYMSARGMEIIVIKGDSMLDVVARYNLYNGGGALPPLWGLGFWHRVPATFSALQSREELAQFEEQNIPLDVLGLEPGWMSRSYPNTFEWQTERFPDPAGFTAELLAKGIRLNLWENPYISPKSRIYEEMYPLSGSHLVWLGIVPDYRLADARRILTEQHSEDHISIGVSGYKIDEVDGHDRWLWPDHATFPSGTSGETMRQSYGLQMQQMIFEELFKKRNTRTYGLVRGSNGSASGYPFVLYSDHYDQTEYITALSSASLSGVLWTPEVRKAASAQEWLNRIQTVCFSPLAQLDAWVDGTKPWSYPSVTDEVRDVIELRMRLLPYLYTAFADYHFKGIPPIRAMVLEEGYSGIADDAGEAVLDGEKNPYAERLSQARNDQFMFGPSILVAPYHGKDVLERSVQLPAGKWYDFRSGEYVGSNEIIQVTGRNIPLFVKEGALIPLLTASVSNTEDAYGHPLELRLYGGVEAAGFLLYEDDGKTFDHDNGAFRLRDITVSRNADGDYSIDERIVKDDAAAMFGDVEVLRVMGE